MRVRILSIICIIVFGAAMFGCTTRTTTTTSTTYEKPYVGDKVAWLRITTFPERAKIYVNDVYRGDSPCTIKVKPGKHVVRAHAKNRSVKRRVVVGNGQTEPVHLKCK